MASARKPKHIVGSLFPLLVILAATAIVFIVIMLAAGYSNYAPAAAILFGLLVLLATGEAALARHESASKTAVDGGPLPIMAVEATDPFNMDGDLPEHDSPHDYPPGNPARLALMERRAAARE
jgi:hypothetical protein